MRNLKRVLALALAVVMMIGMMATASATTYVDDADIDDDYAVAVEVLVDMGILKGQSTTNFAPKATLTRAEAAAMIYRVMTGDVTDSKKSLYDYTSNKLQDIDAGVWYTGYINYCNNGGYVMGDGTNFYPLVQVTGTQFLAMLLRAMGYGQKGEYEGAGWIDNVLTDATDLGLVKNIKNVASLNNPASRELVAQLLFDAIQANTTYYTPAFGYYAGGASLGWSNFNLVEDDTYTDVWGRPGVEYTYKTGAKSSAFVYEADYTTTVAVTECDIAVALGLKKDAKIVSAYVDGVAQTSIYGNDIQLQGFTAAYAVGAQGRLVEIYDMGTVAGVKQLRVVEINTYLAQVDAVNPSFTDPAGHPTTATIDVNVYNTAKNSTPYATAQKILGVKATGYAPKDWVLVNVSNPGTYKAAVEAIQAVTPVAAGTITGQTVASALVAGTTVFGATVYKDADKFFYNNYIPADTTVWNAICDQYGNLIGLTEAAKNYLVVEAVRWIGDSTLYGGTAVANVVLANGTRVENVVIASVGNAKASHNTVANITNGQFDTAYADNGAYYEHIWTYAVNADGTYALIAQHPTNVTCDTTGDVDITKGQTVIVDASAAVVGINDNTVFLVKDKVGAGYGYTYTTYVGKENIPSMADAKICYYKPANSNYASLVVVTDYDLASNTFLAYIDASAGNTGYVLNKGYAFNVYKVGETTATVVYDDTATIGGIAADGWYVITVDSKMALTGNAAVKFGPVLSGSFRAANNISTGVQPYSWDRKMVVSNNDSNMYAANTQADTYWVDNAQYIVMSYTSTGALTNVKAASYSDINWNAPKQVMVAYKTVNSVKQAAYVYVIDQAGSAAATPKLTNAVVKLTSPAVGGTVATTGATVAAVKDNYASCTEHYSGDIIAATKATVEWYVLDETVGSATYGEYVQYTSTAFATGRIYRAKVTLSTTATVPASHGFTEGAFYTVASDIAVGLGIDAGSITYSYATAPTFTYTFARLSA